MDEILRQRDPGLKRAVKALQQGRAAEAVRGFGEVREVPHEELGAEAARLWLALDEEQRAGTAILAPTHFIRAEIHRVVREGLAREGVLHGRELEIERYVNRHLTAAQRADVRHHEPGDFVIFHSRVPPLRVDEGDACRIARAEDGFVFLDHPSGRTVRIRPGRQLGALPFRDLRDGAHPDPAGRPGPLDQERQAARPPQRRGRRWCSGSTPPGAVRPRRRKDAVACPRRPAAPSYRPRLEHDHSRGAGNDAGRGDRRAGYRTRPADRPGGALRGGEPGADRFVLVTDNRETLEEALEDNDGARLTARGGGG